MRFCGHCRTPAETSPCATCAATIQKQTDRRRGSASSRGYDAEWRRLSARARRLFPFCSVCGATSDLTTDHVVPLAAGGPRRGLTLDDVAVLCRPCNSRKGATMSETTRRNLDALKPYTGTRGGAPERPRGTSGGCRVSDTLPPDDGPEVDR